MQEHGRRPVPPFAGVDLRRPRGYPAPAAKEEPAPAGDPCPRCGSRDTKFCYYNNYNTSQPRHFCKSCRRYWTKGGSLRNVPVGGGTRKSSSSSSSSSSATTSASPGAAPTKNTKRSKNSKRRRVAPSPDPATDDATAGVATAAPSTEAAAAATVGASEKPAATEQAAAVVATEKLPAPAPPAAVGGFTDTSTAPGIGLADVGSVGGAKELVEDPSHFEWPSGYDLGPCWGTSMFADTDPALFLNLP